MYSRQFADLNVSCAVNSDEQQSDISWSKLDVIDLSHNDLSLIDSRLFDGPLRTVRYTVHRHNSQLILGIFLTS